MATHLLSFPLLIFLPQSKAPNPRKHRSYRLSQPSPFVINVTHSMCLELAQWMSGNREKIWWVVTGNRKKICKLQGKDLVGVCLFPGKDLGGVTGSREKIYKKSAGYGEQINMLLLVSKEKRGPCHFHIN